MSKLRRPPLRPGIVDRPLPLGRLARDDDRPVVSVVAPPGYGKSTLLSQWAERSGQPFAWVTVEEPDNDPKVLLAYVGQALDEIEPIDGRVFDALAQTLLREIDQILTRRPDLGVFVRQTDQLRARLKKMHSSNTPAASALTAAELRLLPLLSTHLSFPEIAEEMCLSPNTIKSQAYSIYR